MQGAINMNHHVVLWSFRQKFFHIETVEDMIVRHWNAFANNRELEYIPVYFCQTHNQAQDFTKSILETKCAGAEAVRANYEAIGL